MDLETLKARDKALVLERNKLLKYCRKATRAEYQEWLNGYRSIGGEVTHPRDTEFAGFYALVINAHIPELYGARSVKLIVPKSVDLHPSELLQTFHGLSGHNSIFFMNGFQKVSGVVPSFTDCR